MLPYADGEVDVPLPAGGRAAIHPRHAAAGPVGGRRDGVDTDAVPDASRISPPVLLPGFPNPVRLSLEVELHDGGAAGCDEVRSSLHAVARGGPATAIGGSGCIPANGSTATSSCGSAWGTRRSARP